MNEEYIFRQHRFDLRELDIQFILSDLYGLIYPANGLLKIIQTPLLTAYHLFPVPLVDIDGMDVIQFLFRSEGIHIRIDSPALRHVHLRQLHPLPLGKRVNHLSLTSFHILYGE